MAQQQGFLYASNFSFEDLTELFESNRLVQTLREQNFGSLIKHYDDISKKRKKKYVLEETFGKINSEEDGKRFVEILLHSNQDVLAQKLYPKCIDMIDFSYFDPTKNEFGGKFSLGEFSKEDKLANRNIYCELEQNSYVMSSTPRGFCLLINNYFTTGTFKEMQRFRNIFYQLNFQVEMRKNLNAKDILKQVIIYSQSPELSKHSAFVFMIITHGNEVKEISGFDGEKIKIETIVNYFSDKNCPRLKNKPRLFFFNCCRGRLGVPMTPLRPLPEDSDLLICYPCRDGIQATVNWKNGTNYGQALAKSFVDLSWYSELYSILINANSILTMSSNYPMEVNTTMNKKLFFVPWFRFSNK